jgi:hypothetical protein
VFDPVGVSFGPNRDQTNRFGVRAGWARSRPERPLRRLRPLRLAGLPDPDVEVAFTHLHR